MSTSLNPKQRKHQISSPRSLFGVGMMVAWMALESFAMARSASSEAIPARSPSGQEEFPVSRFGVPPTASLVDDPYQWMLKEVGREGSPKRASRSLASVDLSLEDDAQNDVKKGVLPPTILKSGTQEVSIIAHELGFFPKSIFVTQDTPIRIFITSAAKRSLCLMMDEFQVKRQVRPQEVEEVSFTPTTPGQYRFYCPINGMEGTLWVKELTGSLNPQRVQSLSNREE